MSRVLCFCITQNSKLSQLIAQALYSLSQDNAPFRKALLSNPAALQILVQICRADHTDAESSGKGGAKGKGKAKNGVTDSESGMGDGRALLCRVLVAGQSSRYLEGVIVLKIIRRFAEFG